MVQQRSPWVVVVVQMEWLVAVDQVGGEIQALVA